MKKLLLVVLFAVAPACAEEEERSAWDAAGFTAIAADLAKRTTPAVLFSMEAKPSLSAFLPVRDWHDSSKKTVYAQSGIMGKWQKGEKASLQLVPLTVNFFAITAHAFDWKWAKEHSTALPMPDIFLGGAVGTRLDGNVVDNLKDWQWKENVYLMTYVRFGGKS